MWKPDLHPRDEYGRFRMSGASGVWDRLAGGVENAAHRRAIDDYHEAGRALGAFSGPFVPEARPALERHRALKRLLPEAVWANLMPHNDGTWRSGPASPTAYNAFGERLPPMLLEGAVRVGDHPDGHGIGEGRNNASPQANGVWHRPGEYAPGRVPILRNDYGHRMSQLEPEPSTSRRHRDHRGAFARGEIKADARLSGGYEKEVRRKGREIPTASPEVHGAYQNDPRNPVGRMRIAPGHRRRQDRTTWIQRLNARMEDRNG